MLLASARAAPTNQQTNTHRSLSPNRPTREIAGMLYSRSGRHICCLCATEDQFKEYNNHIASNDRYLEVLNRIVQIDGLHHEW